MNKYVKVIIFLIIIFPLKQLYKSLNNDMSKKEMENGYEMVNQYLINGTSVNDVVKSLKPKLWIHVPYNKNSRRWESFYSRSSYNLNQDYMYLTIKSIIDKCGSSFEIALIDDHSFQYLIPNYNINVATLPNPKKQHIRKLCMLKLMYLYGGFIVPPSFLCFKDLIDIYNKGISTVGTFIVENVSKNSYGKSFLPDSSFMGSTKENPIIEKMMKYAHELHNNDHTNEQDFLNYIDKWCYKQVNDKNMLLMDANIIGKKKTDGSPVYLEDIFDSTIPSLHSDIYGLYVPSEDLIKRTKYSWFINLSTDEVLNSDTAFAKLLLASY